MRGLQRVFREGWREIRCRRGMRSTYALRWAMVVLDTVSKGMSFTLRSLFLITGLRSVSIRLI
jgi:hypothetical protein